MLLASIQISPSSVGFTEVLFFLSSSSSSYKLISFPSDASLDDEEEEEDADSDTIDDSSGTGLAEGFS